MDVSSRGITMRNHRFTIAISALGLILGAMPSALAKCQEGYLFSTGGEVAHLQQMKAVGSYGTVITRAGDVWLLKNGSLDVSSKGQAVDIATPNGVAKTIPANSRASLVEPDASIAAATSGSVTVSEASSEIATGITHHDMSAQSRKNKPVQMIMHHDCNFSMVAPYRVRWQAGTALFYAPTGIVIDTNEGIVQAPPGSVFVLSCSFGGVRLMNCSALFPLTFMVPNRETGVSVAAGEELYMCNHRPLPFEVTPSDGVGRKSIKLTDLGAELTAVTSEFSIPSMLRSPNYVKEWTENGGSRTQLAADLLKTAAVMSFARKSAESFYVAPRSNTY